MPSAQPQPQQQPAPQPQGFPPQQPLALPAQTQQTPSLNFNTQTSQPDLTGSLTNLLSGFGQGLGTQQTVPTNQGFTQVQQPLPTPVPVPAPVPAPAPIPVPAPAPIAAPAPKTGGYIPGANFSYSAPKNVPQTSLLTSQNTSLLSEAQQQEIANSFTDFESDRDDQPKVYTLGLLSSLYIYISTN